MAKFRPGQKVKVVSLETLQKIGESDLHGNYLFEGVYWFTSGMVKYCDQIVTIKKVLATDLYLINEDSPKHSWSNLWLEPLSELDMVIDNIENNKYETEI